MSTFRQKAQEIDTGRPSWHIGRGLDVLRAVCRAWLALNICVAPSTKIYTSKYIFRGVFELIRDWKHLYVRIFIVRHWVILPQLQPHRWSENVPPGDGLLGALTTTVAKRQQFACPLRTVPSSLRLQKCASRGLDLIFPILYFVSK